MTTFSFVSARERRLWIWTAATVLAIYSTLGLAPGIAAVLRDRGLLEIFFICGAVLVGAAVLTQGLTKRPRGAEIGVGLGVAAVYILVLVRVSMPEERTHLIEYGVVAALVYEALVEGSRQGRRVRLPSLLAVGVTALLGAIDEGLQAILPNRVFALRDILFNMLAGLMAVATMAALGWARKSAARSRRE